MVLVIGVDIIIVNNNMDIENWFDELGKMDKLDYCTYDEDAGFQC